MKPGFALSLSFQGISLLHRAADGWRSVGEVSPDVPDLTGALTGLRARADALEPDGPTCKIVIPDDQIRYMTIDTGSFQGQAREEMARAALEGATPYEVSELAVDLCFDGTRTHIAAVARETLDEAEAFALEHGFAPVSFVAAPASEDYDREPYFGRAKSLDPALEVEPDLRPVRAVGPARYPEAATETAAEPDPAPRPASPEAAVGPSAPAEPVTPSLAGARRDGLPPVQSARLHLSSAPPAAQPAPATAAPSPDLPDDPPAKAPRESVPARFLRHRGSRAAGKAARAKTQAAIAPPPPMDAPRDETERMTIFGARQRRKVGGKPRHLGLMLTLGLLVFLAAVAAWAAVFLEDGVSGLFAPQDADAPMIAARPQAPVDPATDSGTQAPTTALPAPIRLAPNQPEVPSGPARTEQPTQPTATPAAPASAGQAAVRNAVTGIWLDAPHSLPAPAQVDLENLYEVSIDDRDLSQDAVALPPSAGFTTDLPPESIASPAAAGTAFALDARGLVIPTPQGTLTPDGILVHQGRPPVVPPPTPTRFEIEPPGEAERLQDRLAGLQPRPRPGDLIEQSERARLGGLTRDELRRLRPKTRPRTAKQEAEIDETPTAQAVVVSRRPDARPRDFAAAVQKRRQDRASPSARAASLVPTAPRTVTPRIPSSASVSRRATLDNAIRLNRINLIGVYGTPADRRALVRLPNGRYKKVKVGDRMDGGRILAIGDSELRYQKGGRNVTLKIPSG